MRLFAEKHIQFHSSNLKRNSRLRVHSLLDRVTGDMAFNELVFASFANLKHEIPFAVDFPDYCALTEDNGASSRLHQRKNENRLRRDSLGHK